MCYVHEKPPSCKNYNDITINALEAKITDNIIIL